MNKKVNVIIWIIAICAVMTAAYTFYSKNKPQSIASLSAPSVLSTLAPAPSVPAATTAPSKQSETVKQSSESNKTFAPDFNLKDLNGTNVKLSDYKGKIVILNFWAVWCKYCKQEMPDLNELNTELEKDNDVVIIAVDAQESADTVKSYLSSNNINLKVLLDSDGAITQTYGITGFPTTFIINKDGSLYTYIPGATTKETLLAIIDKAEKGEPVQ